MRDFPRKGFGTPPPVQNFAKLNIDLNDLFIGNQFILVFISLFDFCTVLEGGGDSFTRTDPKMMHTFIAKLQQICEGFKKSHKLGT